MKEWKTNDDIRSIVVGCLFVDVLKPKTINGNGSNGN
jgi:hypothetical protein